MFFGNIITIPTQPQRSLINNNNNSKNNTVNNNKDIKNNNGVLEEHQTKSFWPQIKPYASGRKTTISNHHTNR